MSDTYYSIKKDVDKKGNEIPSFFVSNAVKNVIYTMTGLEVMETKVPDAADVDFISHISGVVLITGSINAMFSLTVAKPTAYLLVSSMTGILPQNLREEELYDGITELVNMISGETRAQMSGRGLHFSTLPPFAIIGDKHFVLHKNKVANLVKKFLVGDKDIYFKVYFL